MKHTVTLNRAQLGKAIVRYICMRTLGGLFFPFHIKESSWRVKFPVVVNLEQDPEDQRLTVEKSDPMDETPGEMETELTRDEIIEAVWIYLPFVGGRSYVQPEAADFSVEIPEKARFLLHFVSMGTKKDECPHNL